MEDSASFARPAPKAPSFMAKVLYVDDEPINLSNFSLTLEKDFTVVTATSGNEALRIFRRGGDFAIVVADQRMPGMSGVELLEQIYSEDPDPIRIILTGYADVDDIIDAVNRGHIHQYIRKPWDSEDLRVTLIRALDSFRLHKENKHLSRRLLQVAEEERKRIANDLHDDFGQVLPSLRYSVEKVRNSLVEPPEQLLKEFETIGQLIERLGDIGRDVACALRPDMLDRLGLAETMRWSITDFSRRHPAIEVEFRVTGSPKPLAEEVEIIIYRLFQEAFNNIAKHARATQVWVLLTFSYPHVLLTVRDNGGGINPHVPVDQRQDGTGCGLRGMQERVTSVNGTLVIHSKPGEGTVVRAELPIAQG